MSRLIPRFRLERHLVALEPELPGCREHPLGGLGSDARLAVDDARDGLEAHPRHTRHIPHRRPTRRLPGRLGAAWRSVGGRLGAGSSRVVRPALGIPGILRDGSCRPLPAQRHGALGRGLRSARCACVRTTDPTPRSAEVRRLRPAAVDNGVIWPASCHPPTTLSSAGRTRPFGDDPDRDGPVRRDPGRIAARPADDRAGCCEPGAPRWRKRCPGLPVAWRPSCSVPRSS